MPSRVPPSVRRPPEVVPGRAPRKDALDVTPVMWRKKRRNAISGNLNSVMPSIVLCNSLRWGANNMAEGDMKTMEKQAEVRHSILRDLYGIYFTIMNYL